MRGVKRKSILACLAILVLSSCFPDNEQSSESSYLSLTSAPSFSDSSASEGVSSSGSRFSSEDISSSLKDSSKGSASSSRSEPVTSSSPLTASSVESSLDDHDYCSVSLYQSNIKSDNTHTPGDVRFDKTIRVRVGEPLYSDSDGRHDFYSSLSPIITEHGDGAYEIAFLFVDEGCTEYYRYGTPILADSSFYYYCRG